jgi:hypothetical protein
LKINVGALSAEGEEMRGEITTIRESSLPKLREGQEELGKQSKMMS